MVVRQAARAPEDGYANELVPGLRAGADADRLAEELAYADARLTELAVAPPPPYDQIALDDDAEEGHWLAFLAALLGPDRALASRPTWASGELPDAPGHGPTIAAYRAWTARHGGTQERAFAGDEGWSPERRFDRVFERLALPGFGRAPRFELLTVLGRTGRQDVRAGQLQLGDAADTAVVAAKRVFGIGERFLLERRARDLAEAAEVALEALDLALRNWSRPEGAERETRAATAGIDEETRARIALALGR